jgi:arginase family enzyme
MERLNVLECPYPYVGWYADDLDSAGFNSWTKPFENRPMTEDFKLCGVYGAGGVPYEIVEFDREAYPHLPPHEAIVQDLSDKVCTAISDGCSVYVSSGYCVYAPAILGGMQRALGCEARLGIVWIDAHADSVVLGKPGTEHATLVGIPLSTSIGLTAPDWRCRACGLAVPCDPRNVLASDLRASDEQCLEMVRHAGVVHLRENQFENRALWAEEVRHLADRVDAIYLSIDADILSPEYVPAYYREEPGGHDPWTLLENMTSVFATGKVAALSTFCFDFDKVGDKREVTCLNAMRVIGGALKTWASV